MLGQAVMSTWPEYDLVGLDLPAIDVTSPASIREQLELYRPQLVINCAAYTAVDQCETDEKKADLVNGSGVGFLAKATNERRIRMVHISTDYVFDGLNPHGYKEDDQTAPVNAYGRTKEHGEQQLFVNSQRAWLVRTSWLYGPDGKNFVTTMLELGQTKKELKVVNDQHGKPTFTHDLSLFIKSLVADHAPFGIYHGVNEDATTWCNFAAAIFRQAGLTVTVKPCTTAEFPRPAKRPTYSTLLNTKRAPLRPWTEALRDYLTKLGYPTG